MIITYRHLHHNHDHCNQYPTTMNNAAGLPQCTEKGPNRDGGPISIRTWEASSVYSFFFFQVFYFYSIYFTKDYLQMGTTTTKVHEKAQRFFLSFFFISTNKFIY